MTDLLNGKIDFFGYEINPNTTLEAFEKNIGGKFLKCSCHKYDWR